MDGSLVLGLMAAALVFLMATNVMRTKPTRSLRRHRWDRFEPDQKLAIAGGVAVILVVLISRCDPR